jgi:FAD/FMN-containing dehydrogenase
VIGWLVPEYGLAFDSLVEVFVVTAGSERLRASAGENPESFGGSAAASTSA